MKRKTMIRREAERLCARAMGRSVEWAMLYLRHDKEAYIFYSMEVEKMSGEEEKIARLCRRSHGLIKQAVPVYRKDDSVDEYRVPAETMYLLLESLNEISSVELPARGRDRVVSGNCCIDMEELDEC